MLASLFHLHPSASLEGSQIFLLCYSRLPATDCETAVVDMQMFLDLCCNLNLLQALFGFV